MHIHPNQITANAQLDSLYAADKAAAKREVERTRRKLLQFASELSGESESCEDCVVLEAHEDKGERKHQPRTREVGTRKRKSDADPEKIEGSISDWA
jgi:hypothetical protein